MTDILNWQRIDHRVTTSGQPSEAQLAALRAAGVTHIINLGLHSHERALPDEAASVAALGMTYMHIPVAFDAPTDADFSLFTAALDACSNGIVHVHCIVNARVSAFFYRLARSRAACDEPAARAAMERVWKPGGIWAAFIDDDAAIGEPSLFAGRDY